MCIVASCTVVMIRMGLFLFEICFKYLTYHRYLKLKACKVNNNTNNNQFDFHSYSSWAQSFYPDPFNIFSCMASLSLSSVLYLFLNSTQVHITPYSDLS